MKLRYLGSNAPEQFPAIHFRDGLNVVFAKVQDPHTLVEDAHNLGKTFLISVIDFALLGGINKDHPFKRKPEVFGDFVFTLTIETPSGTYVTIRRPVQGRSAIRLHRHNEKSVEEALDMPDEAWTESKLSVRRARATLDRWLNLSLLRPYDYRKALNYALRRQPDYAEVFRVSKFSRGNDRDWKPLMALLMGFDHQLLRRKYELDEVIEQLKRDRERYEREAGSRSEEYDEIAGLMELQAAEIDRLRSEVDSFSFEDIERRISGSLVEDVEQAISEANQRRYTLQYEIQEIDHSLSSGFDFDLEEVERVFDEVGRTLPELLVRSYEELVEFNQRISEGRKQRLRSLRDQLAREGATLAERLSELDEERARLLGALREQETLTKYRALQRDLAERERELERHRGRLTVLDRASATQEEILEEKRKRQAVISRIEGEARGGNVVLREVRARFASFIEHVINLPALMSVTVNEAGNLDFGVQTLDRTYRKQETEQGKGMSYRKLLCAAFDLALFATHADREFYRFMYHDGILEALDNRRKRQWLGLVRRVSQEKELQYILTVIDTDLPRDERDQKLLFSAEEIVRELHDGGDQGRLFRISPF